MPQLQCLPEADSRLLVVIQCDASHRVLRARGWHGCRSVESGGLPPVGHRTAATDGHAPRDAPAPQATSAQSCTDGGHSARLTRDAAAAAAAAAQAAAPTATMRATTDLRLLRGREADAAAGP